jgi:hypothetical protein
MSLLDDFKERFPNFDPETVDALFPDVQDDYPNYYDYVYGVSAVIDRAILLLCAHLFVVETLPSDGQVGQLSQSGVRSVSGSFRVQADTTDWRTFFEATKYGGRFLKMINKRQGGIFV